MSQWWSQAVYYTFICNMHTRWTQTSNKLCNKQNKHILAFFSLFLCLFVFNFSIFFSISMEIAKCAYRALTTQKQKQKGILFIIWLYPTLLPVLFSCFFAYVSPNIIIINYMKVSRIEGSNCFIDIPIELPLSQPHVQHTKCVAYHIFK